jgi:hypothetical protein
MKVFWSWQSDLDHKSHRSFIKSCLDEAIGKINHGLDLNESDRPELDHDTKGVAGMADIPTTILRKISESAIFVADVTPILKSPSAKTFPNPNVMIELGYALQKPGPDRMIGVLNTAEGWKVEDLPFDLRFRRMMTFKLKVDASPGDLKRAKDKLIAELTAAITLNISIQMEINTAEKQIEGAASRINMPSVWKTAASTIEHMDAFGRGSKKKVNFIVDSPRAYARLIPAGWMSGKPTVSAIAELPQHLVVNAPLEGGSHGDFGACEEGFVRYWITAGNNVQNFETTNATMFLEEFGEFWSVHGTVIAEFHGGVDLRNESLLRNWYTFLKTANAALDHLGAEKIRRVELGLVQMGQIKWYSEWGDGPLARKSSFSLSFQERDWNEENIRKRLVEAYTGVKNVFALPKATLDEVSKIISTAH